MFVRELKLHDFRSWRAVDLELTTGPTVFTGRNGFGKTNIVEALFYLATLRSHRVATDAPLVHRGRDAAVITATVENLGRELTAELRVNAEGANKAALNGSPQRRARDLLGVLRTVLFAPEDLALVRGDPGERRRFIDELVAQRGPRWAAARADYDRVRDAIAAVVIGGTSLSGGRGTLIGTVFGALIIGTLNNGLDLLGISSYYQQVVKGSIIVGAVLLDVSRRR